MFDLDKLILWACGATILGLSFCLIKTSYDLSRVQSAYNSCGQILNVSKANCSTASKKKGGEWKLK